MENTNTAVETYQLRIWIRKISPQIWRRLLVRSDSTIADLHEILQVAFGWSDEHLHQFLIRGKPYGIESIPMWVLIAQPLAPVLEWSPRTGASCCAFMAKRLPAR